jgi:hypothetical protein
VRRIRFIAIVSCFIGVVKQSQAEEGDDAEYDNRSCARRRARAERRESDIREEDRRNGGDCE